MLQPRVSCLCCETGSVHHFGSVCVKPLQCIHWGAIARCLLCNYNSFFRAPLLFLSPPFHPPHSLSVYQRRKSLMAPSLCLSRTVWSRISVPLSTSARPSISTARWRQDQGHWLSSMLFETSNLLWVSVQYTINTHVEFWMHAAVSGLWTIQQV